MRTSVDKVALIKYYQRTCMRQIPLRLASILLVATLVPVLGIWAPISSVVWAGLYFAAEFEIVRWWKRIQPILETNDDVLIAKLQRSLVTRSAILALVASIPGLLTPLSGHDNMIVGVILSMGIILVIAAQHSLKRHMFFFTAPAASVALLWNLYGLGTGISAWLFLALGFFLLLNARSSQYANAIAYADLVRTQVEADNANAAKSIFLAKMSHEIRTPLNGILGMTQSMGLDRLEPAQHDKLSIISASGRTLLSLVNDLLDFAKIEAEKIDLEDIAFDLQALLGDTFKAAQSTVTHPGLTLELETVDLAGQFTGDPTRVRQIIENVLSNAVKFTTKGMVSLKAVRREMGVSIVITDTGVGIAPDAAARLFEVFAQADETTTRQHGGTGLGLAISKGLALQMGGEITLTSQPGQGTQVTIDLPLRFLGETPDRLDPDLGAIAQDQGNLESAPLRILVAEDNQTNQAVLRSLISHLPVTCAYVEDGHQALAAYRAEVWDLILMDIQMPLMDGLEATRQIRSLEEQAGGHRTPIYALTADVMSHQINTHLAAGIDGHVGKPIVISTLFDLLSKIASEPVKERSPIAKASAI